ncbi:hypothetical protein [Pedobacter immunditicola]|uniref:hypothetical protein n=1 Tax=Pedobacter immunditicola TaxID=3133440 RepID=UPI00309D1AB4
MTKEEKKIKTVKKSMQLQPETSDRDALRDLTIDAQKKPPVTTKGVRRNYRLRLL